MRPAELRDYNCPHCGTWWCAPPTTGRCCACGAVGCPTCMVASDVCLACMGQQAQRIAWMSFTPPAPPQEQQMSERTRTAQECAELVEQKLQEADKLLDDATRHVVAALNAYRAVGDAIREKYVLPEGPK